MSNHALPPQRDKLPHPPALSKRQTAFGRRWFVLARICILAFMLLALGLFLLGLPAYYAQLRTPCSNSLSTCASGQLTIGLAQASQDAGLSLSTYAALIMIITVLSVLICVPVAVLLLWRTSENWMALLVAVLLVAMGTGNPMSARFLEPTLATMLLFLYWLLTFTCGTLVFLLFPNGRFVPRRMRWIMITLAILAILIGIVSFSFHHKAFDLMSDIIWYSFYITSIVAQLYRYWRVSTRVERQQTKIVLFVLLWFLIFVLVTISPEVLVPSLWHSDSLYTLIVYTIGTFVFPLLLALALGIAVLRYRLYDIDIVINRTLVYGTLTLSIVGIYVLVVGSLGTLLQAQGNISISLLATGLVAVLFQPLRERLQRLVNRLMYGDRDTPYQAIARLGQRLEATLTSDAVLPTIVETVAHALKLPYVAMSLKQDEVVSTAAAFGVAQEPLVHLPLLYQGEQVGELLLAPRAPGEAFSSADRKLLEDLARQAGMAVHAVDLTRDLKRLTQDLQRSRTALVTLREEERRRLRRDLHDGLGSALASLNWRAGALRQALTHDPTATHALVVEQQEIIRSTIADIRRLVYDLRPPSLDELGLVGALRERAAQSCSQQNSTPSQDGTAALQIQVFAPRPLPPLPAAIEVAAYRIVQEALANVLRHAHAHRCQIRLWLEREVLHMEVIDDGMGLPPTYRTGVGLVSMRERAEELGGTCAVMRAEEGGTRVQVYLPFSYEPRTAVMHPQIVATHAQEEVSQ